MHMADLQAATGDDSMTRHLSPAARAHTDRLAASRAVGARQLLSRGPHAGRRAHDVAAGGDIMASNYRCEVLNRDGIDNGGSC